MIINFILNSLVLTITVQCAPMNNPPHDGSEEIQPSGHRDSSSPSIAARRGHGRLREVIIPEYLEDDHAVLIGEMPDGVGQEEEEEPRQRVPPPPLDLNAFQNPDRVRRDPSDFLGLRRNSDPGFSPAYTAEELGDVPPPGQSESGPQTSRLIGGGSGELPPPAFGLPRQRRRAERGFEPDQAVEGDATAWVNVLPGRRDDPPRGTEPPVRRRPVREVENLGGKSCAICLGEFFRESGENPLNLETGVVIETPCEYPHYFHEACMNSWLQTGRTCPTCRSEISRPQN